MYSDFSELSSKICLMGNCWEKPHKEENTLAVSSVQTLGIPKSFNTYAKSTSTSTQTMSSAGDSVSSGNTPKGQILPSDCLRLFTYSELKNATRNFRVDSVLGEGGFGCVFKGWVDEHGFMASKPGTGMAIAVKKMNNEGLQGHKEWLAEVNYLGQFQHPNLVKLIGYCLEDNQRLLVYEFMSKGSLENHLFRRGYNHMPIPWVTRMKVALGVARGLAFLHNAERQVIYRDFKTSNILLDSNYNPKLSDFGLAKYGPTGDDTHVSTRVVGTYGYAAPEYVATGHLTSRSDVYGFGVVFLEILTGRRALDKNRPSKEQSLVDWAKPFMAEKRKVYRIVDPRLEGEYPPKGAYMAATVALQCLSLEPKHRPTMNTVVEILEKVQEIKLSERHREPQNLTQSRSKSSNHGHNKSNSGSYQSLDSSENKETKPVSVSNPSATNGSRG